MDIGSFLGAFFGPLENVCIRIFSDKKDGKFRGRKLEFPLNRIRDYVNEIGNHNCQNRGIFFVVNYGGHEDSKISRINAQFVECDNLSIDEQYKKIRGFPLEPSIIVRTRKSLHTYWLIRDGNLKKFREVQRALAEYFQGDRSIVNESRVLRIPGFYHCKEEPILVKCEKFDPGLKYTQEEIMEAVGRLSPLTLDEGVAGKGTDMTSSSAHSYTSTAMAPTAMAPAAVEPQIGEQLGIKKVLYGCDFIRHCRENAKSLGENLWYAMITNLGVFKGGHEAIHELSSPYASYNKVETDNKIEHFLRSDTGPMTCEALVERGYVCEKMKNVKCKCKSPAALSYRKVDLVTAKKILKSEAVTKNVTDDLVRAKEFMEEYVVALDEIVAIAFINNDMKEHFALKETYVKPLIKRYKELKGNGNKDTNKSKSSIYNEEMPPWYEVGDKGVKFIPGLLANHMKENVHGFYSAEEYYIYKNGAYREVNEIVASRVVRKHLIDRYSTMNGINDALGQWQILSYKSVEKLNPNPLIINLKNGLYDVKEEKLKAHDPNYLSTVQINANFDEKAQCPRFMEFLKDSLGEAEIAIVQEILGYLLVPINKAQKSFVFVGAGNAGKSTLLSVAQDILLGSRNVSNVPWQALSDRFKTAELFGKLANIFADLPSRSIEDNGIFKSITGEDYLTVEKKNKTPFSFKPYARLLFSCNDVPKNYGDKSNAFYRRLIIIRFEKAVPMEKRDASLKDKLHREANGILLWALEGLKRLMANDYIFSESDKTKKELERYRTESNSALSFVEDICTFNIDRCIELKELYREYGEYCVESGMKATSLKKFSKDLQDSYTQISVEKDTVSRRIIFRGICI